MNNSTHRRCPPPPIHPPTHPPPTTGAEHLAAVEELCTSIVEKYPDALIQFEDFQTDAAFEILEHLRTKVLCFNDDIQGTGAVVLSGFINGMKAQGTELKVCDGTESSNVDCDVWGFVYIVHSTPFMDAIGSMP